MVFIIPYFNVEIYLHAINSFANKNNTLIDLCQGYKYVIIHGENTWNKKVFFPWIKEIFYRN